MTNYFDTGKIVSAFLKQAESRAALQLTNFALTLEFASDMCSIKVSTLLFLYCLITRVAPDIRPAGYPAFSDIRYPAGYPVSFAGYPAG